MTRILLAFGASLVALAAASCCCTSDQKPPRLRPLPHFQEIDTTTTVQSEVHYAK